MNASSFMLVLSASIPTYTYLHVATTFLPNYLPTHVPACLCRYLPYLVSLCVCVFVYPYVCLSTCIYLAGWLAGWLLVSPMYMHA